MLKNIPKVDKVLEWPEVRSFLEEYPRPVVITAVRDTLDLLRAELLSGAAAAQSLEKKAVAERIRGALVRTTTPGLRRVINGTGVILHTNLGRAPISESLRDSMLDAAFGYSTLEFDLESGARGSRAVHVEKLLCSLTGAEAAVVVNNNAAAVLLALSALARGKEVVVSRGELVEIGGSFRIPEVMEQSGAILREVGATNRTHVRDYRSAVGEETALLLKVHTSNFAVVGFTSEVTTGELVTIGRETSVPVMVDAGSGTLVNLSAYGLPGETTVQEYLAAGADLVTFSGDKLLGGPQAGILVGKRSCLEPMKKHPLLRALRVDKVTLAALEGTLRLYRDERQALEQIPSLRMLTVSGEELASRARATVRRMRRALPAAVSLKTLPGFSQVGGGTFPLLEIPTSLIAVSVAGLSAQQLEQKLRTSPLPVIGRISQGEFLLDLRTLSDQEIPEIIAALQSIAA
ncbi:MAG: L-seryl-tRNA(Sec) selenium transferase [Deltaproteobacteria bacterium]|nr:L-seryl-tRNA(Sec) selenium transferase [Deltaproteobacteria bacterium]TLN04641.1 MAG: L-seryl-tRNA(Sec) selenium transferase [bacterium]